MMYYIYEIFPLRFIDFLLSFVTCGHIYGLVHECGNSNVLKWICSIYLSKFTTA